MEFDFDFAATNFEILGRRKGVKGKETKQRNHAFKILRRKLFSTDKCILNQ